MTHTHQAGSRRALGVVLALTVAYTVAEIIGGLLTGSLALLADAGHMLGDSAALALALGAAWLATRPATPERSFGFRRAEILAALANGLALVAIAIWVFVEAVRRLDDPPHVLGGWMLFVAVIGLAVNVAAAAILARTAEDNLKTLRLAYRRLRIHSQRRGRVHPALRFKIRTRRIIRAILRSWQCRSNWLSCLW